MAGGWRDRADLSPGDSRSAESALTALVEGFKASLHALGRPDPQIQLRLLRICLDACRLNHVFRAADCTGLRDLVTRPSGALRIYLTGFPLHDNQCQAAARVVLGSPTPSKCATSPACPRA